MTSFPPSSVTTRRLLAYGTALAYRLPAGYCGNRPKQGQRNHADISPLSSSPAKPSGRRCSVVRHWRANSERADKLSTGWQNRTDQRQRIASASRQRARESCEHIVPGSNNGSGGQRGLAAVDRMVRRVHRAAGVVAAGHRREMAKRHPRQGGPDPAGQLIVQAAPPFPNQQAQARRPHSFGAGKHVPDRTRVLSRKNSTPSRQTTADENRPDRNGSRASHSRSCVDSAGPCQSAMPHAILFLTLHVHMYSPGASRASPLGFCFKKKPADLAGRSDKQCRSGNRRLVNRA